MSSLRANIIRSLSSAYLKTIDIEHMDIVKRRLQIDRMMRFLPTAFGVEVKQDRVNGLYAEWFIPERANEDKLLLYLHGGGYVAGGCDMHRQFVSHIARAAQVKALLPEYRLAPENKYPAALDDAVACYETLLAEGFAASDIVIAGDSAGGGLSVATLLALRDRGIALPSAAVLLSPFLDATASGESMQTRSAQDPWFSADKVAIIANYFCEPEEQKDPYVSPVFANVSALPPMYVQVGNDEILLSDSERLRDKILDAGGEIELDVWPDMWHVFQMFITKMPEAREAVDKIGLFISQKLA